MNGYARDRWRSIVLARAPFGLCQKCLIAPAVEADHITPLADGGAELDPANGWALCAVCHRERSTAQSHRRGSPFRQRAARRAAKPRSPAA